MTTIEIGILAAAAVAVVLLLAFFLKRKKIPDSQTTEGPSGDAEKITPSASVESASDSTRESEVAASTGDSGESRDTADQKSGTEDSQSAESGEALELTEKIRPADAEEKIEITPEGVRLDETAELTAVQELKRTRRERKLQKLRTGLSQTRGGLISKIGSLFKEKKQIDATLLEELEVALITSDVGAKTTEWLLTLVREALDKNELKDPNAVWALLKEEIRHTLTVSAEPFEIPEKKPFTIMVVGVNGAGKTTTIGKLASQFADEGQKIVLAAADTFRAAAVNQLEIWGRRTNSEVVKPAREGADPSSVVFDAVKKATETGADIVIADTAGRLHTQAPLMEELKKISRVMGKAHEGAPHEILLVLDATNGQNALQQVKEFGEALNISGIALTKLDGTAKGGVIIGICHEYKIPVRYIGIGEAKDSLRPFEVDDFVDALFMQENEAE